MEKHLIGADRLHKEPKVEPDIGKDMGAADWRLLGAAGWVQDCNHLNGEEHVDGWDVQKVLWA